MTGEDGKNGWSEYRPSKTLWFWSCVGCVAATMVVGFTWGGWVTGGTADYQAAQAREEGRAQLAATICVERFTGAPDAAVELAALKDMSTWGRDDAIEDGGWVTPAGLTEPVAGAADLCADRLAEMDLPQSAEVEEAAAPAAVEAN
jgi:hypothetical protein